MTYFYPHYDIILILLYVTAIFIGYLIGRMRPIQVYDNAGYSGLSLSKDKSLKRTEEKQIIEKIKSVDIDDTIFIHSLDTSGMEKKFDTISTTTEKPAEIEQSINKLSQIIKGK